LTREASAPPGIEGGRREMQETARLGAAVKPAGRNRVPGSRLAVSDAGKQGAGHCGSVGGGVQGGGKGRERGTGNGRGVVVCLRPVLLHASPGGWYSQPVPKGARALGRDRTGSHDIPPVPCSLFPALTAAPRSTRAPVPPAPAVAPSPGPAPCHGRP